MLNITPASVCFTIMFFGGSSGTACDGITDDGFGETPAFSSGSVFDEAAAEEEEEEEEETETNDNKETVINDERTEEELAEAKKADAIAHELQDVQKIIKKKEKKQVSAPEEMNSNFKSDASGSEELTGSTSEG